MSCSRVSLTFTFTKRWSYSKIKCSAFQHSLENVKHQTLRRPELRCPGIWHRAIFSRRFEQTYYFHCRESLSSGDTAIPRNFWNWNETESHPRRPEFSPTLCREPQISQFMSGWSQNMPVISIPITASQISPCLLHLHIKIFRATSVTFSYTFQPSFNLVTMTGEYTKSDAFRCVTGLYRVSIFKARLCGFTADDTAEWPTTPMALQLSTKC
jgi:hypothetical protein